MREIMRATVVLLAVGVCACGVCADEIEAKMGSSFMTYSSVKVTNFADGKVAYTTSSGQNLVKPLADVRRMSIKTLDGFDEAEKLAVKGQALAEAVKLYDKAYGKVRHKWLRTLIATRRLGALDAGGMADRAVKEWLALADDNAAVAWVLAARPTTMGRKGTSANKTAMTTLERKRAAGKRSKAYDAAIVDVLMKLYGREGLRAKATALADGSSTPSNGGNGNGNGNGHPPAAGMFTSIEAWLDDDKPRKAVDAINKNLRSYTRSQLPKALLLRGRARVLLAAGETGKDKDRLLLQGGLDFMRVYAAFRTSRDEASEALFRAGRVHTMLSKPNVQAARAAYKKVISEFSQSKAARDARKALGALGG